MTQTHLLPRVARHLPDFYVHEGSSVSIDLKAYLRYPAQEALAFSLLPPASLPQGLYLHEKGVLGGSAKKGSARTRLYLVSVQIRNAHGVLRIQLRIFVRPAIGQTQGDDAEMTDSQRRLIENEISKAHEKSDPDASLGARRPDAPSGPQESLGEGLSAHPILGKSQLLSGVPENLTPDTTHNKDAIENLQNLDPKLVPPQLQPIHALKNQPTASPYSTPTLRR